VVLDPDLPVTLHEQLAEIIRARIKSGEYVSRVPSATTLAQEFGVSHRTSEHALRTLRDEGLITPVFGRGYFVSKPGKSQS
jgi:GntR family phosphonate transport system transcriptional regulator